LQLNIYVIKKFIIYILFFIIPGSCVDTSQIIDTNISEKLFVLCEIRSGTPVVADISFTGSGSGVRPVTIDDLDKMNIGILRKDKGEYVPLTFDQEMNRFTIDSSLIDFYPGKEYELILSRFGFGPEVRNSISLPEAIKIQDIITNRYDTLKTDDQKIKTIVRSTISFERPVQLPAYFHLIARTPEGKEYKVEKFFGSVSAFTNMKKTEGFLVDYSRADGNTIVIEWSVTDVKAHEIIHLEFCNVKEQYYRFLLFTDGIRQWPEGNPENPGIIPLNINSTGIIGSFHALTPTHQIFKIN
jgi:hypothetical protein